MKKISLGDLWYPVAHNRPQSYPKTPKLIDRVIVTNKYWRFVFRNGVAHCENNYSIQNIMSKYSKFHICGFEVKY